MSKVVLPIQMNLEVKAYHDTAFPTSVMFAEDNNSEFWLFNNMLQLKYNFKSDKALDFDYKFFIFWEDIKYQYFFVTKKTLIDKIKHRIVNQKYIYIEVDEYFIPLRRAYQTRHFTHNLLIYGFDDSTNEFYTVAYNTTNHFSKQKIEYEDVLLGYFNREPKAPGKIFSFSYYKKNSIKIVDKTRVSKQLNEFLNPPLKKNIQYGVNTYDVLEKTIAAANNLDIRSFKILVEHKNVLLKLIKYYFGEGEIYNRYSEVKKNFDLMYSLAIKYSITQKKEIVYRISKLLKKAKIHERAIVNEVLLRFS